MFIHNALGYDATINDLVVFQHKCGLETGASLRGLLEQVPRGLGADGDVIAFACRPNRRGWAQNIRIATITSARMHEL